MTEVVVPLAQVIVSPDDVDELGWQDQALCAQTDPEAFFPEKGGSTREAKRVCRSCEVRAECLEYALENDERFGIWGGMSERERRRLKREAVLPAGPGWVSAGSRLGAAATASGPWVPRRPDIARSPGWTCAGCVSLVLS
jgi:WhiB family transcriptional regulator, redox-sensing transcriptional regulator